MKKIAFVKNNIVTEILEIEDQVADLFLDSSLTRVDLGYITPVNLDKNNGHTDQNFSGRVNITGYIYNPDLKTFRKPE
jgi:hypothetical protein